jgi:hypothetical protein
MSSQICFRSRTKSGQHGVAGELVGGVQDPCRLTGLINVGLALFRVQQPAQARPVLYVLSHLGLESVARGSDDERSSITKSGHRGRNLRFCSAVRFASRSRRTQEASGERTAPFGRMKPPLESKATPVASCLLQSCTWAVSSAFLLLVSPPVGGMISRSPSAVRSMR